MGYSKKEKIILQEVGHRVSIESFICVNVLLFIQCANNTWKYILYVAACESRLGKVLYYLLFVLSKQWVTISEDIMVLGHEKVIVRLIEGGNAVKPHLAILASLLITPQWIFYVLAHV